MTNRDIKKFCELSEECLSLLRMAVTRMNLSARSYRQIIKLARTIADLEEIKILNLHILQKRCDTGLNWKLPIDVKNIFT